MRRCVVVLATMVVVLVPGAALGGAAASAQIAASSAVTVSAAAGSPFAGLQVTVPQTKNLINQVVRVTWKGAKPTDNATSSNFLSLMQCWGDDAAGPDPMQCVYGAAGVGSPLLGFAKTRTLPAAELANGSLPPPTDNRNTSLPFWPVGGTRPTAYGDGTSEYFDSQITNEVQLARTGADGTGQIDFELQTLRQDAGLGCGAPSGNPPVGRSCWLVIVPRGDTVTTSPLSKAAWAEHLQVPLDFLPQGQPCPIGSAERRLIGHEESLDAVTRWQPTLCGNGGALYSYTQVTDNQARAQLTESVDPNMAITANPIADPAHPVVYAPVAVSGLAIAFNMVANPSVLPGLPPPASKGRPFTSMKLNQRLVAKLLTQSYRSSLVDDGAAQLLGSVLVPARPAELPNNPISLVFDPEFLALNPDYKDQFSQQGVPVLVQLNAGDLTGTLWAWVLADPAAKAWLGGQPDENKMVVNPANVNPQLPLTTFPRNDDPCKTVFPNASDLTKVVKFCTSDQFQFAGDMHTAARAASRGDALSGDPDAVTQQQGTTLVTYGKLPRQTTDSSRLIAVVDSASAARYGLATASLASSGGQFVAPDAAGLAAGVAAMKPSAQSPDVLVADPAGTNAAAYPLTSVSYAAAMPAAWTGTDAAQAATDYAAFLRYAAAGGQTPGDLPGQLPVGYSPLTDALKAKTLAAATAIENAVKATPSPTPTPAPTAAPAANTSGSGSTTNGTSSAGSPGATGSTGTSSGGASGTAASAAGSSGTSSTTTAGGTGGGAAAAAGATGAGTNPAAAAGGTTPAASPNAVNQATQPVAATKPTPALPAPDVGALLVTLLIGGGLAGVSAPASHFLAVRRANGGGGDAVGRTEVTAGTS